MAEIATWSAILNKTGLGKTSNECPTKAELLALNNGKNPDVDKVIVISNAASYGNNECVKLEDINAEQWIYTFQWDSPNGNPSFNAPATGGTYPFGSYASNRVKQVNGVNTNISQSLKDDVTKTSEGSWYTTDSEGNKGRIVPNNTSTNSKSTTVTWTQKYSGKTIQATFTQAAGSRVYSSWSYNCRVDKTSFSYSGGQSNVIAKSASRTYTWNGIGSSYTESETAIGIGIASPASISGNTIIIPSNSSSARTFTVTFTFSTAPNYNLTISQEGGQVTYVDHLSIEPITKTVSGSGQTFDVIVNANYDKYLNGVYQENIKSEYTNAKVVEGTASDITITRTSTGCSIKVAPNPNENSSRNYVVEFTYDSATPVRLNIHQGQGIVSYPDSGYSLTQSTLRDSGFSTNSIIFSEIDSKGSSFTIYFKSYRTKYINGISTGILESVNPNITPRETWLKYNVETPNPSDHIYEVRFMVQENSTSSERSAEYVASIIGDSNIVRGTFFQKEAEEAFYNIDFTGIERENHSWVLIKGNKVPSFKMSYYNTTYNGIYTIWSSYNGLEVKGQNSGEVTRAFPGDTLTLLFWPVRNEESTANLDLSERRQHQDGIIAATFTLEAKDMKIPVKPWYTLKIIGLGNRSIGSNYYLFSRNIKPLGKPSEYDRLALFDEGTCNTCGVARVFFTTDGGKFRVNTANGGIQEVGAGATLDLYYDQPDTSIDTLILMATNYSVQSKDQEWNTRENIHS